MWYYRSVAFTLKNQISLASYNITYVVMAAPPTDNSAKELSTTLIEQKEQKVAQYFFLPHNKFQAKMQNNTSWPETTFHIPS